MIIAIDGPAASGKGTLGKRLAKHYGYRHLDTGVIYRAVAKALLDAGADLTDEVLRGLGRARARSRKVRQSRAEDPGGGRRRLGGLGDPESAGGAVRIFSVNSPRIRRARCSMAATSAP